MISCPVSDNLILDSRLALLDSGRKWMAVADLHYGYEISQRVSGWLIPLWGMKAIEERLFDLVEHYHPARLILAVDIVHSTVAKRQAEDFVTRLSRLGPELILIKGNHDRGLRDLPLLDQISIDQFRFHHGHLDFAREPAMIDVVGHVHPSWKFNDGAGSCVRRPAMVQTENCFILPAFSPWAAGARFDLGQPHRIWVCGKNRILPLDVG
jgi:uncharacterized protein